MKKLFAIALMICLSPLGAKTFAQAPATPAPTPAAAPAKDAKASGGGDLYKKPLYKRPITVSASIGTLGFGVTGRLGITPHWRANIGLNYLSLNYNKTFNINGFQADVTASPKWGNVHVFGEWRPFLSSSFRVVGGLAYFFTGKADITIQPVGAYTFGEITLDGKKDIGQLYGNLNWGGLAPYLGIGLFKSQPTVHKIGVNLDLGMYMMHSPKSTIDGTLLFKENNISTTQVDDNLSNYRWMPNIQVNVSYRIK